MSAPTFVKRISRKIIGDRTHNRAGEIVDPDSHRGGLGHMWEEKGKMQFDFLIGQGLRPENYLLDVGCACLRSGVHFIKYLEPGHYFGIDKSKESLDDGQRIELERSKLRHKNPILVQMDNFDFLSLDQQFEYALAQSVFTHLPLNSITRCIMNIEKVLVQGGRFFATFAENTEGKLNLEPIRWNERVTTYFDKDPYHYDFETFTHICEGTSLRAEYIGEWQHLIDSKIKMVVFVKM